MKMKSSNTKSHRRFLTVASIVTVALTIANFFSRRNKKVTSLFLLITLIMYFVLFSTAIIVFGACPPSCPVPPNPTPYNCNYGLRNCVPVLSYVSIASRERKSTAMTTYLSCNSCNEKNKGSVSSGISNSTVNYTWSINLPNDLGSLSGTCSEEINGNATLNCQDCANITAPFVKYDVVVKLNVPYTVKSITGFPNNSWCFPLNYILVTTNCAGDTETVTYNTYEYELGASSPNECPDPEPGSPCYSGE
jgi:hypothetical protein